MVGVKKLAWGSLGDHCPYYKKDEEFKWARRNERHEKLKSAVVVEMTAKYGPELRCVEECTLRGESIGRVDLICWNKGEVFLIEVKSSPVWRASSHDSAQLQIYAKIMLMNDSVIECEDDVKTVIDEVRSGKRQLRLLLAYRGDRPEEPKIIDLHYDIGSLDIEELLSTYEGIMRSIKNSYVVGPWCFTCANETCPVASAIRGVRGGAS